MKIRLVFAPLLAVACGFVMIAAASGVAGRQASAAEEREWGGYTGYFADPDGVRWEIAYNPGPVGRTVLP